ncbi:hypothetical protein JT358_07785 [Micrococcales bacterium 31B]|nr:hypothetical protein [Micrococcales bacterium 31B]
MPSLLSVALYCGLSIVAFEAAGYLILRSWGARIGTALLMAPAAVLALVATAGLAQTQITVTFGLWYLGTLWAFSCLLGLVVRFLLVHRVREVNVPPPAASKRTRLRALAGISALDTKRDLDRDLFGEHNPPGQRGPDATGGPTRSGLPASATSGGVPEVPRNHSFVRVGVPLGLLVSAALAFVTFTGALRGDWGVASQTWDAMTHLNAIRRIVETGNASPWNLLSYPQIEVLRPAFYPAVFHQFAATVIALTGCSVLVGGNLAAFLLAGWVFPAGCVVLVRVCLPRLPLAQVSAALLATSMWSFPWAPLGWGVLWPTATSLAVVPFALAAGISTLNLFSRRALLDRVGFATLFVGFTLTSVLAHPQGALQLVAITGFCLLGYLVSRAVTAARFGLHAAWPHLALAIAYIALACWSVPAIFVRLVQASDDKVAAVYWPIRQSMLDEALAYTIQAPNQSVAAPFLALLLAAGGIYALVRHRHAWLVLTFVAFALLDIFAASTHDDTFLTLSRLWYNDRYRITGATSIVGIPLAALGVHVLTQGALALYRRWKHRGQYAHAAPANPLTARTRVAATAGVLALTAAATLGFNAYGHAQYLAGYYGAVEDAPVGSLLSVDEQAFLDTLPHYVKPDEVVVNLPGDGSGLMYAVSGVQPLYPFTNTIGATENADVMSRYLTEPGQLPRLCANLDLINARWLLNSDRLFQAEAVTPREVPGLRVREGDPNFTLVAAGGGMRLYRITGCDSR